MPPSVKDSKAMHHTFYACWCVIVRKAYQVKMGELPGFFSYTTLLLQGTSSFPFKLIDLFGKLYVFWKGTVAYTPEFREFDECYLLVRERKRKKEEEEKRTKKKEEERKKEEEELLKKKKTTEDSDEKMEPGHLKEEIDRLWKQLDPSQIITVNMIKKLHTIAKGGFGVVRLVTAHEPKGGIKSLDKASQLQFSFIQEKKDLAFKMFKKGHNQPKQMIKAMEEFIQQRKLFGIKHMAFRIPEPFYFFDTTEKCTKDGKFGIIMEYCKYYHLGVHCYSKTKLDLARLCCDMISCVLEYINGIRDRIVHRDIKPGNFFVCDRDGIPRVVIGDFGLTTTIPSTTIGGHSIPISKGKVVDFCGTVPFMSPEMVGDRKVFAFSDLWSVGISMYSLFNLELHPFPHFIQEVHQLDLSVPVNYKIFKDKFKEQHAMLLSGKIGRLEDTINFRDIEGMSSWRMFDHGEEVRDGLLKLYKLLLHPNPKERHQSSNACEEIIARIEPYLPSLSEVIIKTGRVCAKGGIVSRKEHQE
ncbi:hypothetical protein ADUPG1_010506 [Aduncisulcus paluster]|uniref:Protein kinase domain-containing protein n=1 Tax=Aduncisulcus paluster TaxID=2918883 RepID=A0ABQ5JX24_9EUKA|nr:hypothetical protein ADUPG1_010506 [Aduncisulcus paluster]